MLAARGIHESWERLLDSGVANRIYVTKDVVLRVATDHEDAIVDAYTESVAAPIARLAGVRTPALIAFDDSRTLVDRPFSLWERVHGETFGLAKLTEKARRQLWREVGEQLAQLHVAVRDCPDPLGYLDSPGREMDWESELEEFRSARGLKASEVREVAELFRELEPSAAQRRNILCGANGGLLALIDWGDAGWGDPVLEFAAVPLDALDAVLEGYGARERLGRQWEARLVWDQLMQALERAMEDPKSLVPVRQLRLHLEGQI